MPYRQESYTSAWLYAPVPALYEAHSSIYNVSCFFSMNSVLELLR